MTHGPESEHSALPSGKGASGLDAGAEAVQRIVTAAEQLGFVRVGIAKAERFEAAADALRQWLERGYQGHMRYLAEGSERAAPQALLENARTVIVAALPYAQQAALPLRRSATEGPVALTGKIADYALGTDYHEVIHVKLKRLAQACSDVLGRPVAYRICVDSAPLLEREAARRAGFAFIGKNTMAIVPGVGSRVLLGELITDADLPPTDAAVDAGCGRCRACLDACPTGAFVGPHVLDARKCISYLTIELKGDIPRELRAAIGTRVFGCDVCQDVCPFNGSSHPTPPASELVPRADRELPDLIALLELTSAGYRRLTKHSALRRAQNRSRLARNAAVALGNTGDPRAVEPLSRALRTHKAALVRSHAAWALGVLGGAEAQRALEHALSAEADTGVREEVRLAMEAVGGQ